MLNFIALLEYQAAGKTTKAERSDISVGGWDRNGMTGSCRRRGRRARYSRGGGGGRDREEGVHKHVSYWAAWNQGKMAPIHAHGQKDKIRESHLKTEESRRKEAKRAWSVKEDGVGTEMQQDQIRAYRLFILVNTTPTSYLKL